MRYAWSFLLLFAGFLLVVAAVISMASVAGSILIANAAGNLNLVDTDTARQLAADVTAQPGQVLKTVLYAAELAAGTILVSLGVKKLVQ